jgi:pimeloyl-ACP methyl ester carboxylesterase
MNKLKLSDGRILSYQEYGNPRGKPLFYFHGWPASRLSGKNLDKPAKKQKIRVISPDRPGFGHSIIKKDRLLLSWPDDMLELANHLKIKKFSILGASGGAPYTLACAYKIPQRLDRVIISAGLGPIAKLKNSKNTPLKSRYLLSHSHYLLHLLKILLPTYNFLLKHTPSLYLTLWLGNKPESDIKAIKKNKYFDSHKLSSLQAYRQGMGGALIEAKIYTKDWGFEINKINKKVRLWHGYQDRSTPIWMGKYVARNLKNCKATFIKDGGHFLLLTHGEKILSAIYDSV